jgi:O-antigen/teichoic acid export membrane protein/glycosyltransferase involved in cell wall biosynthesis
MSLKDLKASMATIGRESWLLFCAVTVANASNYVFHVVISRMLDPDDYGALGAVLAILILLSVPLGAVQTTVAKRIAQTTVTDKSRKESWVNFLRTIVPVGLALTLVLVGTSPLIQSFLRLDSIWAAVFVAVYVLPALMLTICRGVLQGSLRFQQLAILSVIPILVRLAVGVPLVRAGSGVAGAVGASVIAETAGVALAMWLMRSGGAAKWLAAIKDPTFLREVLPIMAGLTAIWLVIELDLILARRFLPPTGAGNYAAAGLLARAVLFVPGAVSLVALPHFSRDRGRGEDAHRWLMSSAAMVVGLGIATAVGLSVFGKLAVALTFGDEYSDAVRLLPILSFAMVGMGLANLLVFFHIAAGSRMFQLLWPIAALEALSITLWHGSGETVALIVVATSWIASSFGLFAARSVSLSPTLLSRLPDSLSLRERRQEEAADIPDLSLVIPTYNGGSGLARTVESTLKVLIDTGRSFETIVVSDGTTDESVERLAHAAETIDILHYSRRHGKGVALRVGMTRARGRYVAFIDGDGDLDAGELKSFLMLMDMYGPDMVIGSKRHPLSRVEYPPTRRVMSWLYQRLVRLLFGLNVRDTQTGMKLIRRDVLDAVLPRMLEKRYAFDLEFMVVARRLGYSRFFEAPVRLDYKFDSTVSARAGFRILMDTAAIFYRRYILRFYDYAIVDRPVGSPAYSAQLATLVEHAAGP